MHALTPMAELSLGGGRRHERGFTLIEMILVLALLVIVSAVAAPRLGDLTARKGEGAARKLQSDVAYAQELAMTRNQRYRVYFNTAPAPAAGYAVVNDADGDGNWGEAGEFAASPTSSGNLSVTLDAGPYVGVTISIVGFSGSYVEFSTLGVPYDGGGALTAAQSVTVAGGAGPPQTVSVQPDTGRVSVP